MGKAGVGFAAEAEADWLRCGGGAEDEGDEDEPESKVAVQLEALNLPDVWTAGYTGKGVGIHDLSPGANHELQTDRKGLIWFSDIVNDAVGYLDPKTAEIRTYPAPKVKGRERNGSLYGFVMAPDREHVWYSEVAIGHLGSFNTRTRKFEDSIVLPESSGPRRIAISDDGILYAAL